MRVNVLSERMGKCGIYKRETHDQYQIKNKTNTANTCMPKLEMISQFVNVHTQIFTLEIFKYIELSRKRK